MPLLIVLFIVVPIAELYVIIKVGELIGVLPTLVLLLADALLGALLLKHQGRGAWRRFNEALAARRFPGREVVDGVLIVIGGTLLLTPGFITDVAGLFLLIPPTRAIARRLLRRFTLGRFTVIGLGGGPGPFRAPGGAGGEPFGGSGGPGSRPSRDYDFEGSAEEVAPDSGQEPRLPRDRG